MFGDYDGPLYPCPWCTLVYTDPQERDRCTCPNRRRADDGT